MRLKPLVEILTSAVLGLLLTGCGGEKSDAPQADGGRSSAGNGSQRVVPIEIDPESIQVTDWQGVEQLVAQHKGQVVVVYLWAMFSVPATNEFPQFARLCREHAAELHCISVSVDLTEGGEEAESLREQLAAFASKHGADFDHVISSVAAEQLNEQIDLKTGIPAVYVYDREGQLARRFDNDDPDQPEFSFRKDVVPFVEDLVAGR